MKHLLWNPHAVWHPARFHTFVISLSITLCLQMTRHVWPQIMKFLNLPRCTKIRIHPLIFLPSCSRMLAYGLCSTARPPDILMGWYQRPRQSSLPSGYFTTTASTPTLRYHQRSLWVFFFYVSCLFCAVFHKQVSIPVAKLRVCFCVL